MNNYQLFKLISTLRYRAPARVATTVAGTLATSFENGDTIDGVVLATGDRILIKDQADAKENGVYVVRASGAPVRASDADTGSELVSYTLVITEGTVNHDTEWTCINDAITIGSTNISFVFIGGTSVVIGPASSTDNAIVRFDGTTGKTLQNSSVLIDDTGIMTGGIWQGTPVAVLYGGTGASTAAGARTNLGLGTLATQDANNVAITGGSISGTTSITVQDASLFIVDNADNTKIVKLHAENVTTGTTRDWFFPDSSDAFVGISTPQSIASKIFTFSVIGNTNQVTLLDTQFTLQDNLDSTKQTVFQLSGITTATTRTLTIPNASGTLALTSDLSGYVTSVSGTTNRITSTGGTTPVIDIGTDVVTLLGIQSLSNKTFDVSNLFFIADANFVLRDNADNTKQGTFELSGISTGTVRTLTWPNASGTIALTSDLHSAVTFAGENYLSLSGQQITAAAVNLSGTNVTGTLAAARFPALTGDVTTSAGSLATTLATVVATKGGTGQTSYAVGDLLYASTTTALSKLADVAAGSYLRSGGVNTAPVWSTTTLPNSATTGDLLYASASNVYSNLAAVAVGKELRSNGTSTAPIYATAGGCVLSFRLNTGSSWAANAYLGIADDGSSTINTNIVPWVAPVAGTLFNLRVGALANAPSTLHILIYKASNATSPTYSATALDATVTNATNNGTDTTHTVSVAAGDMIVAFSNTLWNTNGVSVTCMFIPN